MSVQRKRHRVALGVEALEDRTALSAGLTAAYYDTLSLVGTPLRRIDPEINFDWGSGSPHASLGADTFSVRWTGQVAAQFTEPYTFFTQTDDGVRLWIDGHLLIDQWIDQPVTEWGATINLIAGQHYGITMEYYENGGGAIAKLLWSSPSTPKAPIPQASLSSSKTVTFDFEDQWATSKPESGWFSSLSMTKSDVTVQVTRPGSWFDIVANTDDQTKPWEFGAKSLDPFYNPYSTNTPFIVNLSVPAMRVSLNMGDYGQDTPDTLVVEAFSGPNATGSLLATATTQMAALKNDVFDFRRLEVSALGINSLRIIGGTSTAPNSVYVDNLTVTPAPTMFVFLFGGYSSSATNTGLALLPPHILSQAQPAGTVRLRMATTLGWGVRTVATQLNRARNYVRNQLVQWAAEPDDIVVFVGHSYGGNLAYTLASDLSVDVDGDGRGADVVVTFDAIDWNRCPPGTLGRGGKQTGLIRSHPSGVIVGNTLNLYQRKDRWLRGYKIANAFLNAEFNSTHKLIDNDKGPGPDGLANTKDDVWLGAFNLVHTFLWLRAVTSSSP